MLALFPTVASPVSWLSPDYSKAEEMTMLAKLSVFFPDGDIQWR